MFVNPGSGADGSPTAEEIAAALEPCGLDVAEVDPDRLPGRVRDALARQCALIGVAGGDGTVRSVAEILAGTDVPLLVVPAGTRNHFARELGLEDLDAAVQATRAGHVRRLSVGTVNGHVFVNNASIGLYPEMVRRREQQESYRSKRMASLSAAAELLRRGRPVNVCVDGTDVDAWLVFVGNGRYGEGFTDLIERDSLESTVLDVRVVRADRRLARTRVAAALVAGRLRRTSLIICEETAELPVGVEGRHIEVAVDGEVVNLQAPLRFAVRPAALAVVAPPARD